MVVVQPLLFLMFQINEEVRNSQGKKSTLNWNLVSVICFKTVLCNGTTPFYICYDVYTYKSCTLILIEHLSYRFIILHPMINYRIQITMVQWYV